MRTLSTTALNEVAKAISVLFRGIAIPLLLGLLTYPLQTKFNIPTSAFVWALLGGISFSIASLIVLFVIEKER